MERIAARHWISLVLSGAGFAACQPPRNPSWLAGLCLVPWLLTLPRLGLGGALVSGLAFGTVAGLTVIHWAPASIAALGYSAVASIGLWIAAGGWYSGIPWMILGSALWWALGLRSPIKACAVAAVATMGVDGVRSLASSAVSAWALAGHTQAGAPGVEQLAVVGGVPAISAFVVVLNVATALSLRGRQLSRTAAAGWGAYLALRVGGAPLAEWARPNHPEREKVLVLVIQPRVAFEDRWSPDSQLTNLAIIARQTEAALASHPKPDVIVWPETTITSPVGREEPLGKALQASVAAFGTPLVVGVATEPIPAHARHYRNSAAWIDPARGWIDVVHKSIGVPLLESAGGRASAFVRSLAGAANLPVMQAGGEERALAGDFELAVLFCYEAMLPGLAQARRTSAAVVLLNLANDGWLADEAAIEQQLAFASFRAIEQRLFLVRAAHAGTSAVIDPFGRRMATLARDTADVLEASVWREAPPSYAEKAALVLLASAGAVSAALVCHAARRKR